MLVAIFLWLIILASGDAFKILMLPVIFKSHVSSSLEISKALGRLGHVTYVVISDSYLVEPETEARAKEYGVTILRYRTGWKSQEVEVKNRVDVIIKSLLKGESIEGFFNNTTRSYREHQAKSLLEDNEELIEQINTLGIEMAVVDSTFTSKYLNLLVHRLGVPWITYTDFPDPWLMRSPWLPSLIPGQFYSEKWEMSFWQRFWNTVLSVTRREYEECFSLSVLNKYQQYGEFKSSRELAERSQLWLITTHPLMEYPRPMLPTMIEIGGVMTKPASHLPTDLQSFLDGAESGVILLSFGSMFSVFPDELLSKFLDVFERLDKYRIVWVLQGNNSDVSFPSHIKTGRWLPQNDVLGHPKMKLFITHCGNNGQFEALYHGVPMLGFPFIGDQYHNCHRMEYKGYGLTMSIRDFTSDELYSNILKVLADPNYKRRISKASEIFRSEPQHPADKAAYWIDHVTKYGSEHLESTGKGLNFFQFFMLDILLVVGVVGVLLLVVIKRVLFWIVKSILASRENQKKKNR